MPHSLIIGSGPAAAGVALALSERPDERITVLDVGARLSAYKRSVVDRLAAQPVWSWPEEDVDSIRPEAVSPSRDSLPEKRSYGSDYPFRDVGQLRGLRSLGATNRSVISGAYGGFSTVWGAQVMPLSDSMFGDWPFGAQEMNPHYQAILSNIPFAGEKDDLAELFPLLVEPQPLPPVHPRTRMVLDAYEQHREKLRALGVTLGHARLAFDAGRCVSCGLCLTGCPHSLIYSASQTFDKLIASGRVEYHPGLLAYRLSETEAGPRVDAWEVAVQRDHAFTADRIFVACGAFGSTRLVMASLKLFDRPLPILESAQFVLPAMSLKSGIDTRSLQGFTLNQFNMVIDLDEDGRDLAQVHFYAYDPAYLDAMPLPLRTRAGRPIALQLLRRVMVGLGYLPSWASPQLQVIARSPNGGERLPEVEISTHEVGSRPPMLKPVLQRMRRAAPHLDLWPISPLTFVSAGGKSYHFGGSFPHTASPRADALFTDTAGRLPAWRRIHLVDGAVLPTIPASTFTLTVMANAHRIAEAAVTVT
jgi:choline dehydrogenase-like flavoprotein